MQAEAQHIETMLAMQQVDLHVLQDKKKLQSLPQRSKILHVREKRTALQAKQASVAEMHAEAKRKLTRVVNEDESLRDKMAGIQAIIDSARGDYRAIESRTKELDGIAKRRATLSGGIEVLSAEEDKAAALAQQIETMIGQLDAQEGKLVDSFKSEGGALQRSIAQLEQKRAAMAQQLPAELLAVYDKAAQRCGGVAIGVLKENGTCSVCRTELDDPHLLDIRSKRPLAECPSCHRLLVVS